MRENHEIDEDFKSDGSDVSSRRDSVLSTDIGGLDHSNRPSSSPQCGPSNSRNRQQDISQSISPPSGSKAYSAKDEDRKDSDTRSKDHRYTTLKSVKKKSKAAHMKSNEQHSHQEEEQTEEEQVIGDYEVVDVESDDVGEHPGSQVVVSESDNREDLAIPELNQEPGPFWHLTIAPGKRHLIQVLVATPRATLSWKFSTEKKSIAFGIAFKLSETKKDQECQTVVPSSQYNSHLKATKGEIQDVAPGVYILVFDNSLSRFTSKRLFCMVQVSRKDCADDVS